MVKIAFTAADWNAESIMGCLIENGINITSAQAYVTSRHADYEASNLVQQLVLDWVKKKGKFIFAERDFDTQDDTPSAVCVGVDNLTDAALVDLSVKEGFYVL